MESNSSHNISNPVTASNVAAFATVAISPNLPNNATRCQPMSPSSDHHATLKAFAAYRESLPPAERLGMWHLLTACYGDGVQGLTYEAVRLECCVAELSQTLILVVSRTVER